MNLKRSLLCLTLVITPVLRADFVGVYDYMTGLAGTYAAQTGSEQWTFHTGDQNGALMGLYGGAGYGNLGAFAQFTSPGAAGTVAPGSAPTNEAAGIFTHTASSGLISAVFHADTAFTAESFTFTHELVANGNLGNGIDLYLRTVIGGVASDHGSFSITNTLSAQTSFTFGSGGLSFNSGDMVVVMFDARGSYFHDHGWWDIALQEVNSTTVPDQATTAILLTMGLLGLASLRRHGRLAAN